MESGSYDGGQASNRGFQSFENVAADAILSINFNASGTRFATGAADHKIRVYDVIDDGEEYKPVEQWRAHNAEILDVLLPPGLHLFFACLFCSTALSVLYNIRISFLFLGPMACRSSWFSPMFNWRR